MHNKMRGTDKFFWFIFVLMPLLMIPTILFGGEADKKPERNPESQAGYILKVKGDFISLKAKNASIKEILEDIGRRMEIEVIANVPREEKITVEFDMMYLGDAIKRFRKNYAYITESEKESGKITKIVVEPKGMGKVRFKKLEYNPQPSMRKLEYNPQPSLQKDEVKREKRLVEPGIKGRTFDYNPQPSLQ